MSIGIVMFFLIVHKFIALTCDFQLQSIKILLN
jgi:hypothetical protein